MSISSDDHAFLRQAVDLARQALDVGDEPFGSVLVSPDGEVLLADHNHVGGGDHTRHPELAIAQWAAEHLSPGERARCVVYTSGEHCPMCAAAHAWVGLGRIVYAGSSAQLGAWLAEVGVPPGRWRRCRSPPSRPASPWTGPVDEFADELRALHQTAARRRTELRGASAGAGQPASDPAKICQASADFAPRLSTR